MTAIALLEENLIGGTVSSINMGSLQVLEVGSNRAAPALLEGGNYFQMRWSGSNWSGYGAVSVLDGSVDNAVITCSQPTPTVTYGYCPDLNAVVHLINLTNTSDLPIVLLHY